MRSGPKPAFSSLFPDSGECLTPPPLVAERAFSASHYGGLTKVSDVHGPWQESVGISDRLLIPATHAAKSAKGLSATPGLALGRLGTHQRLLGSYFPGPP